MSVYVQNAYWGIIFLIHLFFQQTGFTQTRDSNICHSYCFSGQSPLLDFNCRLFQYPIHWHFSSLQSNKVNSENTHKFQMNQSITSNTNSKSGPFTIEILPAKKIKLKCGKFLISKYKKKNYYIIIDPDSNKIASFIDNLQRQREQTCQRLPENLFWYHEIIKNDSLLIPTRMGGHFYWTVLEWGRDGNFKKIKKNLPKILSFIVPGANLEIQQFTFEHSAWITPDDYQGELKVELKNIGNQIAQHIWLILTDSVLTPFELLEMGNPKELKHIKTFARKHLNKIEPGKTLSLTFPWRTPFHGRHKIRIQVLDQNEHFEYSQCSQIFSTIPKGVIITDENPIALKITQVSLEMPIITEISFDANSSAVRPEYLRKLFFEPPLLVLANRLKQTPEASIILQGFSDLNSESYDKNLADNRSKSIKDSLINLGVQEEQIIIQHGRILPRIQNAVFIDESRWVFEERRHVRIVIKPIYQNRLLNPIQYVDCEADPQLIRFELLMKRPIRFKGGSLSFCHDELKDEIDFSNQIAFPKTLQWTPVKMLADSGWLDKKITYYLTLTDSSGRTFKTKDQSIFLRKLILNKEHRMVLPLKFAQSNPHLEAYWSSIFDQIMCLFPDPEKRLYITGHACAIGSEESNRLLSQKRAERFHAGLMEYIRKKHPEYYGVIKERLIPARGFGEFTPLTISRLNGEQIVIGNNNQALGRKLNRRIEVIFAQVSTLDDL